jgi:hypothetical protein
MYARKQFAATGSGKQSASLRSSLTPKHGGQGMRSDRSEGELERKVSAVNEGARHSFETEQKTVVESSAFDREEQRKIRRLQLMMEMVMSVISQDHSLTVDEAAEMIGDTRKAALAMFPDKELAYNLIYKPRLQRLMRERFRIQ